MHDVGNPFQQHGAGRRCLPQPFDGIVAIGIDAGAEAEIGVAAGGAGDEFVRHVDLRLLPIQFASRIDHAIEGQHHRLCHALGFGDGGADSSDDQFVPLSLHFLHGDAEGAQIDRKAPTFAHLPIDEGVAAGADSGSVNMQVHPLGLRLGGGIARGCG